MNLAPCYSPGCGAPRKGNGRYCEAHSGSRQESAHRRGYGARWRRLRKVFLAKFPYCYRCEKAGSPVTAATELHHIRPKRDGGPDTPDNLAPLCEPCHGLLTWLETHQGVEAAQEELFRPTKEGRTIDDS